MPFHPRNKHQGQYDLDVLLAAAPALQHAIIIKKNGEKSLDFGKASTVYQLNKALLATHYQLPHWTLPEDALCPPVPSRADYIHHLADLLSLATGHLPKGKKTRLLDIGTGASCIYPLLGTAIYNWSFVGVDQNKASIQWAHQLVIEQKRLRDSITLRWQANKTHIFEGVVLPKDYFAASLCNPPFFASAKEARAQQERKWKQLHPNQPSPNFGGQAHELHYPGGEVAFIENMIQESQYYQQQIGWFTTLVSQEKHLKTLEKALKKVEVAQQKVIEMEHGNKKSRVLCWRY